MNANLDASDDVAGKIRRVNSLVFERAQSNDRSSNGIQNVNAMGVLGVVDGFFNVVALKLTGRTDGFVLKMGGRYEMGSEDETEL
jgi:hypothetical protein